MTGQGPHDAQSVDFLEAEGTGHQSGRYRAILFNGFVRVSCQLIGLLPRLLRRYRARHQIPASLQNGVQKAGALVAKDVPLAQQKGHENQVRAIEFVLSYFISLFLKCFGVIE